VASLTTSKNGTRRIQFVNSNKERKTIHLGKTPLKRCQNIKLHIEELVASECSNLPLDQQTAAWIGGLDDEALYAKLVKVGLVPNREKRETKTLGAFITEYIADRKDISSGTRENLGHARRYLVEFFGAEREIHTIRRGDADRYAFAMKGKYAEATAAKSLKNARQFFAAAVRLELIEKNPFDGIKPGSMENKSRMRFITKEDTEKILAAAPNAQWRLLIALARYGGLRTPSESLALEWANIDWENGKMLVRSPKTGDRWVPLFAELRPHLEEGFDPESIHVITKTRSTRSNLRTHFHRIIRRAGLTPWEKPFQNLRSSRETELAQTFPIHVVVAWIGNSVPVAAKHYLQVTEADFEKAAKRDAESDAQVTQIPTHAGTLKNGPELKKKAEVSAGKENLEFSRIQDSSSKSDLTPRA
jgi:integrase